MFAGRPAVTAGRRLYLAAVEQARTPGFYTRWGVPDTADGRFELYSLHVILLLHRLKDGGEAAAETAQGLFDAYVKSLDDAMREAGVGDLSVGKKVRRLGEAFMGRLKSYDAAFATLPDRTELEALIARTVYDGEVARAGPLAAYADAAVSRLFAEPLATVLDGRAAWPETPR
jgi:cytochrome b pre-mRNA-processing protein 3